MSGASGAKGRQRKEESRADQIRAVVPLTENETIFILVGQKGISYCEINGVRQQCIITRLFLVHNKSINISAAES